MFVFFCIVVKFLKGKKKFVKKKKKEKKKKRKLKKLKNLQPTWMIKRNVLYTKEIQNKHYFSCFLYFYFLLSQYYKVKGNFFCLGSHYNHFRP